METKIFRKIFILTIALIGNEDVFTQTGNLFIFDTTHQEAFLYHPFIPILENSNWKVTYAGFDKIMDMDEQASSPSAQAAFFIFGIEFLKSLGTDSPVTKKILTLLNNYCQQPNKLIGLVFPSLNMNPQINLVEKFASLFSPLGLQTSQPQDKFVQNFIILTNTFLTWPLESRPIKYHTTLSTPHNGISFQHPKIKQLLDESGESLKILPVPAKYNEIAAATMPYGILWTNPIKQNHVFITHQTVLAFSGITESCHFCPNDFEIRKEMLYGIRDMINQLPYKSANDNLLDNSQTPTANSNVLIEDFGKNLKQNEKYPLRKTAWMELNVFEPLQVDSTLTATQSNEKIVQRQQQQDKLINFIVKSKLDALWISICPNMFYSPIARKASGEKTMQETIALFTKKLKAAIDATQANTPKILIGFEITNNIYEPNMPKPCAHDVYNNSYFDVPDPIDPNFWHNEIELPTEKFVDTWNNPEINNGIQISGIIIDFEMYCRKTTGIFLSPMGFNNRNFNLFLHKNSIPQQKMTVNEMAQFLIDKKMATKYFDFLESQATELGRKLKNTFTQKIPGCIIACYTPNILISWFYKGLYLGMSDDENPVHLFSFNAEYANHQKWFTENKINATHSSVLLLSKITDKKAYEWVRNILKNHDGVWFNRYSRLVEPRTNDPRDWTAIEKPQIPQDQYPDFVDYIGEVN